MVFRTALLFMASEMSSAALGILDRNKVAAAIGTVPFLPDF
jgi:hypothetical protein